MTELEREWPKSGGETMSERKHIYEAGTKCWCGEPAPPAPPAAPDLADYQEWWSRQIPNNFKHESAVAIAYAQSKLARAESELEQVKAERDRLREALETIKGGWDWPTKAVAEAARKLLEGE